MTETVSDPPGRASPMRTGAARRTAAQTDWIGGSAGSEARGTLSRTGDRSRLVFRVWWAREFTALSLFVSRVARVLSRSGERVGMSALRKWLASAMAAGLLVGGLSGGLALGAGQSEAEKNHEQAM